MHYLNLLIQHQLSYIRIIDFPDINLVSIYAFLVFLDAFCSLDEFFIAIYFSVEH
jgi:hypothetical protein